MAIIKKTTKSTKTVSGKILNIIPYSRVIKEEVQTSYYLVDENGEVIREVESPRQVDLDKLSQNSDFPYKEPAQRKELLQVLILFIKADRGSKLLSKMSQANSLYPEAVNDLYINTMKMWIGTEQEYAKSFIKNEFKRIATDENTAKEYDYIAVRLKLNKAYAGSSVNADSYERNQFFKAICEDCIPCIEFSKRLSFDLNSNNEAYSLQ